MKYLLLAILSIQSVIMAADSQNTEVMVYHDTHDSARKQTILQEGLYSYEGLMRRNIKEARGEALPLPDQNKIIYFAYDTWNSINPTTTVGYKVDPTNTYVYNGDFRAKGDLTGYLGSKMLLRDYIERLNKRHQMQNQSKPNYCILQNPMSAEPIEIDTSTPFGQCCLEDCLYIYLNEIIIEAECISPAQLINLETMGA